MVARAAFSAAAQPAAAASPSGGTRFSNSYYEFPIQPPDLAADTPLYTARCGLIGHVPRSFHDELCVQGSGQLASGATVSFAVRDCACAELCPRTEQRICFEELDPVRFPHGRGATGRAITPLVTVAVDPAVVPLGAVLFIPEFRGLARQDGAPHDGCFVAEDRGLRIKGHRLDVFAGDVATRRSWDGAVPHNHGVHVFIGDPRCSRAELRRAGADVQRTR
jgi:3D (Asp-Asp-Asp) domain-containing protein